MYRLLVVTNNHPEQNIIASLQVYVEGGRITQLMFSDRGVLYLTVEDPELLSSWQIEGRLLTNRSLGIQLACVCLSKNDSSGWSLYGVKRDT